MKKTILKTSMVQLAIGAVLATVIACGEDSSTSSSPETTVMSSTLTDSIVGSSDSFDPAVPVSSVGSSEQQESDILPPDTTCCNTAVTATFATEKTLSVIPDTNGFYYVADIYKAAPETYKIAFVLRHAERESGLGQESPLTAVGVQQAIDLGKALVGTDESFYYASTDFIRTRETCNNIAKGRGETSYVTETQAELLNGSYFLTVSSDSLDAFAKKKGGGWKIISVYAYGEDYYADLVKLHFYDLIERGNQFVMENVVANMPKWKRVSILVSHDVLLEPLVVYASNREVDVNYYRSGRWVNYMTGVAVVLNASNQVELYPVRGTDIGYMTQKKVVIRTDSTVTVVNPAE